MNIDFKSYLKKEYVLESLIILIIFSLTWFGFGKYMAVLITTAFLFCFFFKEKVKFLIKDRFFIVILLIFTLNNVVSSLLSIDRLISTFLSIVWFFVIFIPTSYVRFSINEKNVFFIRWIVPISFLISFIILIYLSSLFIYDLTTGRFIALNEIVKFDHAIKRYTFLFLGKASTPDTIIMLGGIGYGFIRQKNDKKNLWYGFIYLIFCLFGVFLTFDRGGFISFFIIMIILLSFDYKRLILFILLIGLLVLLSFKIEYLKGIQHFYNYFYSQHSRLLLKKFSQIATFKSAWGMIKDYWLFGVGTNNFSKFSKQYGNHLWFAYAHNFILQFWAENGLFGMILGLTIIGIILYRWLKSFNQYKYKYIVLGVGASFIGMLVGNLTNSTIWILKIALPFWLLAGIINAIYFLIKDEEEDKRLLT